MLLPGSSILHVWFNREPIEFQPLLFISQRLLTIAAFACRVLFNYYFNPQRALNLRVTLVRQPVQAVPAVVAPVPVPRDFG